MNAATVTTALAVEAIAWGRAPKHPRRATLNLRVVCADGYIASVQASAMHYANDSHPDGSGPYWRGVDEGTVWPFISFEIGNPTSDPTPADVWDEYDSGGVWSSVPRQIVADLLNAHGGATGWETPS